MIFMALTNAPALCGTMTAKEKIFPLGCKSLPMMIKRVVFWALVLISSANTAKPYSSAFSFAAMAAFFLSFCLATYSAANAVFGYGINSYPLPSKNCFD